MLYFPTLDHMRYFDLLTYPLPSGLLPWLYARGLGVWLLPEDKELAQQLIHEHIGVKQRKFPFGSRLIAETSHYDIQRKIIFLTHQSLFERKENVVLHEIGHAIDYLFCSRGCPISRYKGVVKALCPTKPLTKYCAKSYKKTGILTEQFATAFTAYFYEPEKHRYEKNITDLSPKLIKFFRTRLIEPF